MSDNLWSSTVQSTDLRVKQLLDEVSVISRIIKVEVGYQPQPKAEAYKPYGDLDSILDIKKPNF